MNDVLHCRIFEANDNTTLTSVATLKIFLMIFSYPKDIIEKAATSWSQTLVDVELGTMFGAGTNQIVLQRAVDELHYDWAVICLINPTETVRNTDVSRLDDQLQFFFDDFADDVCCVFISCLGRYDAGSTEDQALPTTILLQFVDVGLECLEFLLQAITIITQLFYLFILRL